MESRYTTNKSIIPEILMRKMRKAFLRSEEHLDQSKADDALEQRLQVQQIIQDATPQQLGHILEALRAGKMGQVAASW